MHIETASQYLTAHGSPLEQARLAALRSGTPAILQPAELAAASNADGGWAFGLVPGRPSALHATVAALQALDDLGQTATPVAAAGRQFLADRATRRGVWREDPALTAWELAPWMDPTSTPADIYTTALCANALAGPDEHELVVDRAVSWLQTQQGRDGLLAGFRLHSSWLALPAFAQQIGRDARATRRLVGSLGEALTGEWSGAMLAECLLACRRAGYGLRTPLVQRAWEWLQASQQPDGSITVEEGESATEATLRAVTVALHLTPGQG